MDEIVRQVLENEHRFKIGRRIGRGGFAEVHEARSTEGVPCAIKFLFEPIDDQYSQVAKEGNIVKLTKTAAAHPHIVRLLDVWLIRGHLVTTASYTLTFWYSRAV